jgi:hypothetical protein
VGVNGHKITIYSNIPKPPEAIKSAHKQATLFFLTPIFNFFFLCSFSSLLKIALSVDGDLYIKKMGDGELISINPDYNDISLNEYIELIILGRIVDRMSKEEFDEIQSIVWE